MKKDIYKSNEAYDVFDLDDGGEMWKDLTLPEGIGIYYYISKPSTKCHRLDGPAVFDSYRKDFYINGIKFSEEDYWKQPEIVSYLKNLRSKLKPEDFNTSLDLINI